MGAKVDNKQAAAKGKPTRRQVKKKKDQFQVGTDGMQSSIQVLDENNQDVTPLPLSSLKPSVLKSNAREARSQSTSPRSELSEYDRISSFGFSRDTSARGSGRSSPASSATHGEEDLLLDGDGAQGAQPSLDDALEPKESTTVREKLSEEELEKPVDFMLSETPTLTLIDMQGTCVAMDSPSADEVRERNQKYHDLLKQKIGSDLYVERGMQTLSMVKKSKDVHAAPPKMCDAAEMATAWDIHDSIDKEIQSAKMEAAAREEAETGTNVAKSAEQQRVQLLKMIDDALEAARKEEEKGDDAAATEEEVKKLPPVDNGLQLVERLVTQNIFFQKHVQYRSRKFASTQAKTTFFSGDGDLPQVELKPLWTYECRLTQKLSVTGFSWNGTKEDLLAVSYGQHDFMEQTGGLVAFWSLKNPEYPDRYMHVRCGVVSLAFSHASPNLLACGYYDGTVALHDVRLAAPDAEKKGLESSHQNGKHAEPVWQVKWVDRGREGGEALVSISSDGRVARWSMKKGLEHTDLMKLKRISTGLDQKQGEAFISRTASGMCLDFCPKDPNVYVAGTEDGNIHKCSCSYSEQYLDNFYGHSGPVYKLRWSPFCPNTFLSCSADWTIRLWSAENGDQPPVLTFQPCTSEVTDICWSPHSSTVFASVTGDGRVDLWDLNLSTLDPVTTHRWSNKKMTSVSFARNSPVLVAGSTDGSTEVLSYSGVEVPPDITIDEQRARLHKATSPKVLE